jgi:hypothetical protein
MTTKLKPNETAMFLHEWAHRAMEQTFGCIVSHHHTIPNDLREMLLTIGNVLRDIRNHKDYISITVEDAPPVIYEKGMPWWEVLKDFSDRNNLGRFESGPVRTFADLARAVTALVNSHPKEIVWHTPMSSARRTSTVSQALPGHSPPA